MIASQGKMVLRECPKGHKFKAGIYLTLLKCPECNKPYYVSECIIRKKSYRTGD